MVIDVDGPMITVRRCCDNGRATIVVFDVQAKGCLSRNLLGDAVVGGGKRCLLRINLVQQIFLYDT
jgi:hypothetical protein